MNYSKRQLMSVGSIVLGIIACSNDRRVSVSSGTENKNVAAEATGKVEQGVAVQNLATTASSTQCSVGVGTTTSNATAPAIFTAQIGVDDTTPAKYNTLHIKINAVSKQGTVIATLFDSDIPRNEMTAITANVDIPLAEDFSIVTDVILGSVINGRISDIGVVILKPEIKVDSLKQSRILTALINRVNPIDNGVLIDDPLAACSQGDATVGGSNRGGSFCFGRYKGVGSALRIEYRVPPIFHSNSNINYTAGAVAVSNPTMFEKTPEGVIDGSLNAGERYVDNTPGIWSDTVDIYFTRFLNPVAISTLVNVGYANSFFQKAPGDFSIFGYANNKWTKICDVKNPNGVVDVVNFPTPIVVRGLRIKQAANVDQNTFNMIELEAWGNKNDTNNVGNIEETIKMTSELNDYVNPSLDANGKKDPANFYRLSEYPDIASGAPKALSQNLPIINFSITNASLSAKKVYMVIKLLRPDLSVVSETKSADISLAAGGQGKGRINSSNTSYAYNINTGNGGVFAYDAKLYVSDNNVLIASAHDTFGVEQAPLSKAVITPAAELLSKDQNNGIYTFYAATDNGWGLSDIMVNKATNAGFDMVGASFYQNVIERYEGCYSVEGIIRSARYAKSKGIGFEPVIGMGKDLSPWFNLDSERMRDSHGAFFPIENGRGNDPSLSSPNMRTKWERFVRETVLRLAGEEGITRWFIKPGLADSWYGTGGSFDYSETNRKAFIDYLKRDAVVVDGIIEGKGLKSIDEANKRYNLGLGGFDELVLPVATNDNIVDLRPLMADFSDFHSYSVESLINLTYKTIYEIDGLGPQKRPLSMYGFGGGGNISLHARNSGNKNIMLGQNSINSGIMSIFGPVIHREGALLRTEITARPYDPDLWGEELFNILNSGVVAFPHMGSTVGLEQYNYSDKIFKNLVLAQPVSREIGALLALSNQLTKGVVLVARNTASRSNTLSGLLAEQQSGRVQLDWFTDYTTFSDKIRNDLTVHKIIVDSNYPVLTQESIDALVGYVNNGGTLILMGNSGQYLKATPDSWYPLLKALNWNVSKQLGPIEPSKSSLTFTLDNTTFQFSSFGDSTVVVPSGATVLAYTLGKQKFPAVVEQSVGKGKVIRVSGEFANDGTSMASFLNYVKKQKGIKDLVNVPSAIQAAVVTKDQGNNTNTQIRYVLLLNTQKTTQAFNASIHANGAGVATLFLWKHGKWTRLSSGRYTPDANGYFNVSSADLSIDETEMGVVAVFPAGSRTPETIP